MTGYTASMASTSTRITGGGIGNGGLDEADLERLKALEQEKAPLERALVEALLDNQIRSQHPEIGERHAAKLIGSRAVACDTTSVCANLPRSARNSSMTRRASIRRPRTAGSPWN